MSLSGAGPRNALVRFERASVSEDANGCETAGAWLLICRSWCSPKYGSGDERRQAAAVAAVQAVTFVANQTPLLRGITTKDRIMWRGERFDIHASILIGNDTIEFTTTLWRG